MTTLLYPKHCSNQAALLNYSAFSSTYLGITKNIYIYWIDEIEGNWEGGSDGDTERGR